MGAAQIGFTLVSLTISLIAVLIPLLFMADVVGRLFREFAITLAVSILISLVVSLTLTPMMCARLLRHRARRRAGWFYREDGARHSTARSPATAAQLQWVLRASAAHAAGGVGDAGADGRRSTSIVPKGFFPVQDTGAIQAITEAPQSISFAAMAERQQAAAQAILARAGRRRACRRSSAWTGTTPRSTAAACSITLAPHDAADAHAPARSSRRCGRALQSVARHHALPAAGTGPDDRGPREPHAVPVHPRGSRRRRLSLWVPRLVDRLRRRPSCRTSRAISGPAASQAYLNIDRDGRQPPRRQRAASTTRSTTRSASG